MEQLSIIHKMKHILGLSQTDLEIIHILSQKEHLLVTEIAEKIKRSRRHVCQRLSALIDKGILDRELHVLHNKRVAYRYSLKSSDHIARHVRVHLLNTIAELDMMTAQ